MKFFHALNNFSSGEWSPAMHYRTDTQQYQNAAKELKNCIVQAKGGVFRRPGTIKLNLTGASAADITAMDLAYGSADPEAALYAATTIRYIPFVLGNSSFVLCAHDDDLATWFVIDIENNKYEVVAHASSVVRTYTPSFIDDIQYAQIGNTLVLSCGSVPPLVLVRIATGGKSGAGGFTMYPWCDFDAGGNVSYPTFMGARRWEAVPYGPMEGATTRGNLVIAGATAVGNTVTVTYPNAEFSGAYTFPFPKYIRCTAGGQTMVVELSSSSSTVVASGKVVYNPGGVAAGTFGTTSGTSWENGEWGPKDNYSDPYATFYPKCVTAFEQRIYFANTVGNQETFWGSRIGNILRMMRVPYAQDSDFSSYASDNSYPWSGSLANGRAQRILAITGDKSLVINTNGSEVVAYTQNGSALGALNVSLASSTSFGAEAVQPYRVNNFLTFVQRAGRRVRDLVFSFEQDQYKSNDLAFVADHLTEGTATDGPEEIVDLCKMEYPNSILFCRTRVNDGGTDHGQLLSLVLDRDYGVNAWSPFEFGGTSAKIMAATVIPSNSLEFGQSKDWLILAVERTVNGARKVHIEYMTSIFEAEDTGQFVPPVYLDSVGFSTLAGVSTNLDNLSHLEGEEVDVIIDGNYIGRQTVSSGTVTGNGAMYSTAFAGLPYETIITPLPIEAGTQLGSAIGTVKRIDEVTIGFWKSYGCEYGREGETLIELDFRDPAANMGDAVQLFTGDKTVKFPPGYDRRTKVTIRQAKPWPCNVLAVVSKGVTYD